MLIIHCPVCNQEFTSELSMRNHYRNLHDCAFWAQTFEKTLVQEAINHPEKEEHIKKVLGAARESVLNKAKSLKSKAETGLTLTQHIKEIKAKHQNNPNS